VRFSAALQQVNRLRFKPW